jgi:serine/threonine protein kinase
MSPGRWKSISPSQFAWEAEALEFLRQGLPDHDPYLAWSNFEFLADDGTINEVDALVLTPMGLFLVEIKSRPGELSGDVHTWCWRHEGRLRTEDNPLFLANRKARKLASRLRQQKAGQKTALPFIEAVVFCSASELRCQLQDVARTNVFLRDGPDGSRPGITQALINRKGLSADRPVRRLDRPTARAVYQALEQAGIRPTQRSRRVGDYELKRLFLENPLGLFQDWEAAHVALPDTTRIVRLYPQARTATQAERNILQRAAEKEFTVLQRLLHPGIVLAEGFTQHELGPALVLRLPASAQRLDHYLAERWERLTVTTRLEIVRQVAEALQFAHGRKVVHRALSPQSVVVLNPEAPVPQVQILNWQLCRRSSASSTGGSTRLSASLHAEQLVEDASAVYLAPEAQRDPDCDAVSQDVFSLGALAYFLFVGRPPATSPIEMSQRVAATHGLDLAGVMDAAGSELRELIKFSTDPVVSGRYDTVADFLCQLGVVEEELTTPENEIRLNPLDARVSDRLPGGLEIKLRLGRGSSAVAFLVTRGGREFVLKLAGKPEYNDRLHSEFEVLSKLDHLGIVQALEAVSLHGLTGFLMDSAGEETLAQRLRKEGRLHLDLLERFGKDLIETVGFLEQAGVSHRDIKPENIGVRKRGKQSEPHLVLFDFSLSNTPPDQLRCGTAQYLDPFLTDRKPPRWDLQAERFSVAMTLYEMATGDLPTWGDGESHPAMLECEADLHPERFDAALREPMQTFFARALRRDYRQRFDNAQDMLKAWEDVFAAAAQPSPSPDSVSSEVRQALIAKATLSTQLIELGLSTRAANALDKLNAITVRDLLRVSLWRLNRLQGVGKQTTREIAQLHGRLRERFPDIQPTTEHEHQPGATAVAPGPEAATIDFVAGQLRETGAHGRAKAEHSLVLALLRLDEQPRPDAPLWPSQTDLARERNHTRQRVGQALATARERWRRFTTLTSLRDVIVELLNTQGGVMTATELADALLAARGSALEEPVRSRNALGVLRAACEAEFGGKDPRFVECRSEGRVLIATGHALGDYAFKLGQQADALAELDPLAPPARVVEALRRVRVPQGAPSLEDTRLVRLAAGVSRRAAVSARLEVYPRGLEPRRAILLSAGALLGTKDLTVEEIQARVGSRYPEAAPLPTQPDELQNLLAATGTRFVWDSTAEGGKGAFSFERPDKVTLTSGSSSNLRGTTPLAVLPPTLAPEVLDRQRFDERLRLTVERGACLILVTQPGEYVRLERRLREAFQPLVCDFDKLLVRELRAESERVGARWDKVLAADGADEQSQDRQKLLLLVNRALGRIESQITSAGSHVLLTNIGLLARYNRFDFLQRLRLVLDVGAVALRTLWVLVPSDQQHALPTLHGRPVPITTPGQWTRVPEAWLEAQVAA